MRSFTTALLSALALSAATSTQGASHNAVKRQIVVPSHGTTVNPADGSTITPGASFPFTYQDRNFCESGYSLIWLYLSVEPPTSANVTTGGQLADGSFVFTFGDFLIPNFGLPAMQNPPPPPSTLTAPTLDIADDTTLYFSVVETYRDCPVRCQSYYVHMLLLTVWAGWRPARIRD
ncbi:hypothetical protein C8Q78DRAFT_984575 [Trametes maxima]|nr:hypothetical protein C8Q78DRAFT_984575 [Trametes maxima]